MHITDYTIGKRQSHRKELEVTAMEALLLDMDQTITMNAVEKAANEKKRARAEEQDKACFGDVV